MDKSAKGIPDGWRTLPIEDCITIIDYRGKSPRKTTFGIPLVTAKIVKDGRILPPEEFIDPKDYNVWMSRGIPQEGDVVMTTEAPLGEIAALDDRKVALAQRLLTLRADPNLIDQRFLKYVMLSPFVQEQLHSRATGTTVLGIRQSEFRRVVLPFPSLPEQRAIASLLRSLDQKIELNRRIIDNLRRLGHAIFNDWFVDFGPIRFKDNEQNRWSNHFSQLFPDSIDKLGSPSGWIYVELRNVLDYLNRGISPSYIEEGGVRVLNQKCIRDSWIDFSKSRRHASEQKPVSGRYLQVGDLVVNSTGVGTLGRVAQVLALDEPTVVDSHVTIVRADQRRITNEYLGFNLSSREIEIERLGAGSTGQTELSRDRLGQLKILEPPLETQRAFSSLVQPINSLRAAAYTEIETLTKLRKLLLPKIMSGSVTILRDGDATECHNDC